MLARQTPLGNRTRILPTPKNYVSPQLLTLQTLTVALTQEVVA